MTKNLKNRLIVRYWKSKIAGKDNCYSTANDSFSRQRTFVASSKIDYFNQLTSNQLLPRYTVLITIYAALVKRYFSDDFSMVYTPHFFKSEKLVDHPLLFSTEFEDKSSLKKFLNSMRLEVQMVSEYLKNSTLEIKKELKRMKFQNCTSFGLSFFPTKIIQSKSNYLFMLTIGSKMNGDLDLSIDFSENFASSSLVTSFLNTYKLWLENLEYYLPLRLNEIAIISKQEKDVVLRKFNKNKKAYPSKRSIADLFEQQVANSPKSLAVTYKNKRYTYLELNKEINKLAHYLIDYRALDKNDIVGVLLPKSDMALITVLAIIKTGASYLPIDVNYPIGRINHIIEDSKIGLIISESNEHHGKIDKCEVISLGSIDYQEKSEENFDRNISSKDLAYVIYTSGSTGLPKGVQIEHGSVVNMSLYQIRFFSINETDRVVWFASTSFDASVSEIMMALLSGAGLIIPDQQIIEQSELLTDFLKMTKSTVITLPPSYLNLLDIEQLVGLRCLITAGESANKADAIQAVKLDIDYFNAYGPTECAVCTSIHKVVPEDLNRSRIPIGKPIANLDVYVLDSEMEPVPIGVVGKLYVSGIGLSRGYLNNPDLTSKKFIENPFNKGEKIYDTGDLVKWLIDGSMEYLGRKDTQVKIRGYRIELGEIENALLTHEKIKQTVVLVNEVDENKVIVAFLVLNGNLRQIDLQDLGSKIGNILPQYMLPNFYVKINSIPLTLHGKIDMTALKQEADRQIKQKKFIAPRDDTERRLAEIWKEILGIERVGSNDNFFMLGGQSLKAANLIGSIHKNIGVGLKLRQLFLNPTLQEQAKLVKSTKKEIFPEIPRLDGQDSYPVSFIQKRLWLLSQVEESSVAYNMPSFIELRGKYDVQTLEKAFYATIRRHEILRTVFKMNENSELRQFILPVEETAHDVIFENFSNKKDGHEKLKYFILKDAYEPFDLESGPLIRIGLFNLSEDIYLLYCNTHHIISDGQSIEIFTEDLLAYYDAFKSGIEPNLPQLTIQHKEYAAWQQMHVLDKTSQTHKSYWLNQLQGEIPSLNLLFSKKRPAVKTYNGSSVMGDIASKTFDQLTLLARTTNTTVYMNLLAVVGILLYRHSYQKDFIIGTPLAGRIHPDLRNQIGCFLNTTALRFRIRGKDKYLNLLERVKNKVLEAHEHQIYPFSMIVDELDIGSDLSRNPLFDVLLVINGNSEQNKPDVNELTLFKKQKDLEKKSKFDLTFYFNVRANRIDYRITYNTDLFEKSKMRRLSQDFDKLLKKIVAVNHFDINEYCNYISDEMEIVEHESFKKIINVDDSNSSIPFGNVVEEFEKKATQVATNIAIELEENYITYKELNLLSDKISGLLHLLSVRKNDIVATLFDESLLQIISLLGIFKSGAIYVPLDKKFQLNHWAELYENIRPKVLIVSKFKSDLPRAFDAIYKYSIPKIVELNVDNDGGLGFVIYNYVNGSYKADKSNVVLPQAHPKVTSNKEDTSYIFFTSGSSGKPKAVLGSHVSLSHFIHWESKQLLITAKDKIGQLTPFSFDASLRDIFVPLLNGGTICIPPRAVKGDMYKLSAWIKEKEITLLHFVPTMFRALSFTGITEKTAMKSKFPKLKYILLAGEKLYNRDIINWRKSYGTNTTVFNLYGATESTLIKSFHMVGTKLDGLPSDNISVGQPISNTKILLINANNEICRINEVGEIYIKTPFLSKGYFKDKTQTAKRFVQNPLKTEKDIIYRTGDYGRYDINRNVTVLGRKDGIIKINGVRCDINSIETTILKLSQVKMVKCMLHEKEQTNSMLVCFYSARTPLSKSIKTHCKKHLSAYEIPSAYYHLKFFPTNANGKIDTTALKQEVDKRLFTPLKFEKALTEAELKLMDIWRAVLNREWISFGGNFFSLGGNSIKLILLKSRIDKVFGVSLNIDQLFKHADFKSQIKLIENSSKTAYEPIGKVRENSHYEISDSQKRIWVLSQTMEGSIAYNMPNCIELNGNHDIDRFKKAINSVVNRHEILRTIFEIDEKGYVYQKILSRDEFDLPIVYKNFKDDAKNKLRKYVEQDALKPFDLVNGPLIRTGLIQMPNHQHVFYYNMHHIICDGWSQRILARDVLAFYHASKKGRKVDLPRLKIQFKDYASWQISKSHTEALKGQRDYWMGKLSGNLPILDLPSSKLRPLIKTYEGGSLTSNISPEIVNDLRDTCHQLGGTLFMGLLTIWNVLFYKYTSQKDMIIGTPITGRDHLELEDQIGFYVNTLALRNKISPEYSFTSFYEKVKKSTLLAYENQQYPFNRLLEELDLKASAGRSPLFDVILVLQSANRNIEGDLLLESSMNNAVGLDLGRSKFDIELIFLEENGGLLLKVNYNTGVYDEEMIKCLIGHFKQLVLSILAFPNKRIKELEYISDFEKEQLLFDFNNTKVHYPKEKTVIDLFLEQVVSSPNHIALVFEDHEITYEELNKISNKLSHFLILKHEVQRGDLLGIKLERNKWLIISLLAVLKTGAAYVPIDLDYPKKRIDYMQSDSKANVVIDKYLIAEFNKQKSYSDVTPKVGATSSDLAYVMYTSGSTGKPKGVMIENKSIVRLVKLNGYYEFSKADTLLAIGSLSFDATTFEFWGPLLNGSRLVLCSKDTLLDGDLLNQVIDENSVNIMLFTPGWLNQLVETHITLFNNLKTILVGGEKLSPFHIGKLRNIYKGLEIINAYGPTEDTTLALTYNIKEVSGEIPIGTPISSASCYILDENHKLVPKGVIGEICLGGDGLARGYLNNPELTKEKFVDNPFIKGTIIYKTGDLGRYLPNGVVQFIGRKDNQVKIRGFRIELAEVENALLQLVEIQQVVAIIKEVKGDMVIVAYLVSKESIIDKQSIDLRLGKELPNYMMPKFYIQMDAIPLSPNGKIDSMALPEIQGFDLVPREYVVPANEFEVKLVEIWRDVLGLEKVGITDNFFEVGGHSLKAARLINEYHNVFKIKLGLKDLFTNTTFKSHRALLESHEQNKYLPIPKVKENKSYPLSDNQRRLWILSQSKEGSTAYNMPSQIELAGNFSVDQLNTAMNRTIERHEILRTVFRKDHKMGQIRQWILATVDLNFKTDYKDFRKVEKKEDMVRSYVAHDSYKPFNLEKGPLLRAGLLQLADERYVFYYNMHHIIADGWSMEVLANDILSFYENKDDGLSKLPKLDIQYKDYSGWLIQQFEEDTFQIHKSYWHNQFKEQLPKLNLSISKRRPKIKTYNGGKVGGDIPFQVLNGFSNIALKTDTSLYMNFVSVVCILLYKYSYQKDFVVGSPIAGRNHKDLANQIGCYVNTVALKVSLQEDDYYINLLNNIKRTVLNAYEHQIYPFGELVDYKQVDRDISRNPLFDVMVVMNQEVQNIKQVSGGAKMEEISKKHIQTSSKSKFDLTVYLNVFDGNMNCSISYNSDLFEKQDIEQMFLKFTILLEQISSNDSLTINQYCEYISNKKELNEHDAFFKDLNVPISEDF